MITAGVARKAKGFSLAELMVVIMIASVVIYGCAEILSEGMQLFRVDQAASDAQIELTKISAVITAELVNSSSKAVFVSNTATGGGGGAYDGIRFATPLDSDGAVHYNADTGKVYWQRYVAYYYVPTVAGADGGVLYRAEREIASSGTGMGAGAGGTPAVTGSDDLEDVVSTLSGMSLDDFATSSNPLFKRRPVSKGLSAFKVKKYDAIETFGSGVDTKKDAYDFSVGAGDKSKKIRNSYYIGLTFRVVPKAK